MSLTKENDDQEERTVGQKLWFKPTDPARFTTHIKNNCKLDKQRYPLFPNGNTIFVRMPEDKIVNFGTVGYTKTINCEITQTWKIVRTKCLGILSCDDPQCQWIGSPPTGRNALDAFLERCVPSL
jgi:hypothetical protein